jgi:threonine/homoserine/homoserine lactone efflux protein
MIAALITGFITAWIMSMPIGPLNAAVISRTLKYGTRYGTIIGIGASLMDLVYCAGAAQINQFLVESPVINLLFQGIGSLALLILGVRQLRAPDTSKPMNYEEANETHPDKSDARAEHAVERMHVRKKGYLGAMLIGILLYATNVAAVPEWIIVAGVWRGWGILLHGFIYNLLFAVGAALGTSAWYSTLIRWINKRQRGFQPQTLSKINFGAGLAMLAFAGYFALEIALNTDWQVIAEHLHLA